MPTHVAAQSQDGFSIQSVGVGGVYFSQSVPSGVNTFSDVFLGSTGSLSASADVRAGKSWKDGYIGAEYMPSYYARFQDARLGDINHAGTWLFSSKLGHRWHASVSGGASMISFDESQFQTTPVARLATAGGTFTDFANASLEGSTTDPSLAQVGGFPPDYAQQQFLFGRRVSTLGLQGSLGYSHSSRLSFDMSYGRSEIWHVADPSDLIGVQYAGVVSNGIGANVSYKLARRTTLSGGGSYMRSASTSLDSTSRSGSVSVSQIMRKRWFLDLSLGLGFTDAATEHEQTVTYLAGLGFKTRSHTFVGSVHRSVDNPYIVGLGIPEYVTHYTSVNAAWYWKQPNSKWDFESSGEHSVQATTNIGAPTTYGLHQRFSHSLGRHFALSLEQSIDRVGARRYIQDGRRYHLQQSTYRATISWLPRVNHER
jgi:hypothetical protein